MQTPLSHAISILEKEVAEGYTSGISVSAVQRAIQQLNMVQEVASTPFGPNLTDYIMHKVNSQKDIARIALRNRVSEEDVNSVARGRGWFDYDEHTNSYEYIAYE